MSSNEEIGTLLRNIQEGLTKYSVNELNDAIIKALSYKNDKKVEIKYVFTIVCNEFGISEYTLKNMTKRGALQDAKQITYCLLYYNVGLSQRYIAKSIFFNWQTSISNGIKRLKKSNIQVKSDREFLEKYELLKNKLLNYIKKQNKLV